MLTARDIEKTFEQKGLLVSLPLGENCLVKKLNYLEKKLYPDGRVELVLLIEFLDENRNEKRDIYSVTGTVKAEARKKIRPPGLDETSGPGIGNFLPLRPDITFDSEEDIFCYLKDSISNLLVDNGYEIKDENDGIDLVFQKKGKYFLLNSILHCSDKRAREKIEKIIESYRRLGPEHDYGIVMLAFQEFLGTSLRAQEIWIFENSETFSYEKLGIYGVDNKNPNQVYPFTIYPRDMNLKRYFIATASQWRRVRSQYVQIERRKVLVKE